MSGTDDSGLNPKIIDALQNDPGTWTVNCLRPDDLLLFAEEGSKSRSAKQTLSHLSDCAYCRHELRAVRQILHEAANVRAQLNAGGAAGVGQRPLRDEPRERVFHGWWRKLQVPALAAACFILVLVVVWQSVMFPRRIREGLELKLLEAQNDLRKQDVLLNETRTTLQQTEQKRREAQRVADAKTREKEDAQRKLAELKLSTTKPHIYNPSPELLTRLLESGTTAGENGHNNDTGPVQLLYPKPQSFTSESKPTFRWKAVPGASSYELYLYRVGTNDAPLKSPHETSNAWSIKTPLAPNSVYEWEVKAKKGDVVIARSSARFIVTPQ